MTIMIVEKKNPLVCHGHFATMERAERHLRDVIPDYVKRGYFMNKTLTAEDFTIVDRPDEKKRR